jgi:hypothetical protein
MISCILSDNTRINSKRNKRNYTLLHMEAEPYTFDR